MNYIIPAILVVAIVLISYKMLKEYQLKKRNEKLKKWFNEKQ
jgi:predicted small secreted protein